MRIDEKPTHHPTYTPGTAAHPRRVVSRRRASIRSPLGLILIAALVIGTGGVGAYAAVSHAGHVQSVVVDDLQKGGNELQLAKAAVVKANAAGGNSAMLKEADAHFKSARGDFQHALDQVQADLVLRGARAAPGVG